MERAGEAIPVSSKRSMIFDVICRGCGACGQANWDPTGPITATMCPDCHGAMSVIGIDFPGGRDQVGLARVLEVIQGAGIKPVAVERHARGRVEAPAA
jgi:hypothetical protein